MLRSSLIVSYLFAILVFLQASPALAESGWTRHLSPNSHSLIWIAKRNGTSLHQATARVKQETGGRILSSKTIKTKSGAVHRVKVLLPNGKVRVIHINAN